MRLRYAFVALAALSAAVLTAGVAGAVDPVLCAAIPPSSSATVNYDNIQDCLDTYGAATLQPNASYPVYQGIVVGGTDVLLGTASTIRFAPSSSSNPDLTKVLLKFAGSGAQVSGVTFDADHKLTSVNYIVQFANTSAQPSGNVLENGAITGGSVPSRTLGGNGVGDTGPTALSFSCTACSGNVVRNMDMYGNYRVVGFHGAANSNANRVELSKIRDNQCDAASFVGYGVLFKNEITNNGGFCYTLHGGGIYADGNTQGARIEGNRIDRTCGHGIDLIRGMNYVVKDNVITRPGEVAADPSHSFCGSATGMSLYNVRTSTITGNDIRNIDAPWNMRNDDPVVSKVFADTGAAPYSDLPNGPNTLMAFALVWNGDQTYTTRSNTFENNVFIAQCSTANCLGLPAFIGRGTGVYANQSVDSATRNTFHGTRVFGSDYRTQRLGRNSWAASHTCDERTDWTPTGCNDDDYRWNPPTGTSPYRNDPNGGTYSSLPL